MILLTETNMQQPLHDSTPSKPSAQVNSSHNHADDQRHISLFANARNPNPVGELSLAEALARIHDGTYQQAIAAARQILHAQGRKAYTKAKNALPAVTFGGTFSYRKNNRLIAHSGLVHGDLDHLADVEATKHQLTADPHVIYCFISPSGDGLKIGISVPTVPDDAAYKVAWQHVADYCKQRYQVTWDPSGKDIARLCFVSWDPALYVALDATPFAVSDRREWYAEQAIQTAVQIIDTSTPGHRHEARLKASNLLGGYIAGGFLIYDMAYAVLEAAVHRNTDDVERSMKTIADGLSNGQRRPFSLSQLEAERAAWWASRSSNGQGPDSYLDDWGDTSTIDGPDAVPPDDQHVASAPGLNQQPQSSSKPIIKISTNMTAVVNRMQAAIRRHPQGPLLYQRAHQLSRIIRGTRAPKWLDRAPDAPIIAPADKAYIRELAAFAATWLKWDDRRKTEVNALPPPWVIETLMARSRWSFPPLEGIICAPTLRPDGSILATPGYDEDTGLYLSLDHQHFPPIPQHPTVDDARRAIQELYEPFSDFPFAASHHKSATVAAIKSVVARFTIQGKVPFFAARSTTRGAGKGLLIDTISVIATGRHAPRWAQTLDEDEERKRLMTIAMAGDAVLHIDNISHPLGSGPLDMAMTAEAITERVMATHTQRTAPLKAVFFGSGNNMVFQSDMARRVVPIDLAPTQERPDEREDFVHHPLLAWVQQQRPRLVVAALTIVKAYIDAGHPKQAGLKAFGSYEEWSDLIRQSLVWAGEPDPCAGRGDIEAESDPKYEMQKVVLTTWYERYGDASKTLKEVKDDSDNHTAREIDDQGRWTGRMVIHPDWRDLHSALLTLTRRGNELDVRAIGYAFRSWQGRVLANLQLKNVGEDRFGTHQWQVKKLSG
jgi:BT4734-like, N-terminal domain